MIQDKDSAVNKSPRGFARLDPERQRAIASAGGRAAHASGNAHQFTSAEARAAGRKGGQARRKTAAAPKST
ncbi:KGG domain-containing protein [Deinococcus kurensis]|uniref:KGG domain-containing protein n=1 Tax=Deinococcus kurensis TaxID=2662757 RepID=UPI00192E439A|nr:KGG domain-containing protein [Deinococcus kurensis]